MYVINILSFICQFYSDTSKSPSYWSKVCLNNIARLAKEATTVRRVLEPLFHHFDVENHWSSDTEVACSVILYLQSLLEESGYIWNLNAPSCCNYFY